VLTIYKYPIPLVDEPHIVMPRRAVILSVDEQFGQPVLWAQVDTDYPTVTRKLRVVGTGGPARGTKLSNFLGTVQIEDLVWHIFDEGELG